MIKANELRIGNWVSIIQDPLKYNDFHQVTGLDSEIHIHNDEVGPFAFYHPIPLTPKILEKAGFVISNKVSMTFKKYTNNQDRECLYLRLMEVGNKTRYSIVYSYNEEVHLKNTIEYLHQLQNLFFSLTGEELTITL